MPLYGGTGGGIVETQAGDRIFAMLDIAKMPELSPFEIVIQTLGSYCVFIVLSVFLRPSIILKISRVNCSFFLSGYLMA